MGARERLPVGRVTRARARRRAGTSRCCSGHTRTGAWRRSWRASARRAIGALEVVQWARANGFPFDMVRCEEAIESGIQDRNMFSSSPSSQARNSSLAAELISRLREM